MDVIFNSIYARACLGAGLAVLTGLRAFLPVAFLALYSRLEFASAPVLDETWFGFLQKTWVIILLFVLAVAEIGVDKLPALSLSRDRIMGPIKIVLGGVVFAAAMSPDGWIAMAASGVLGLAIAGVSDRARRSLRPDPASNMGPVVLMSIYEDAAVLVATLVFVLAPLLGALLACFLVLLTFRIRQRRKRKHKGLRILTG